MSGTKRGAKAQTLAPELLRRINAYWRAANYPSGGWIALYDNPLLKEPLELSHGKPLVVGHWGTTPGQNFIYVHLSRVIDRLPHSGPRGSYLKQRVQDKLIEHEHCIDQRGQD